MLTPVLGQHLGSPYTSERLPFHVTATLGEVYDNNIFVQPHKSSDYVTRLSVLGELQLGNLLSVDGNYLDFIYSPSLHLYARHPHQNGVDQNVDVFYAHHFTKLTLSLEQIYAKTQSTDASIGNLITTDIYTTNAKADYAYSAKLDLVASFRQQFIDYDNPSYVDSKEWSGQIYALYHVDDKLSLGFGPRFGYLILDKAPDENFQQLLGRANYNVSQKLSFKGAAGVEDRQYQTVSRSDTIEPIFELSGIYLPFPSTNLSANAARHFSPSYNLIGQDYISTSVNLMATQRFLDAYYLGLSAGYENDDYQFVDSKVSGPTREDNYFFLQPSLRWSPNGWLVVSAFDKYEEDHSNFAIYGYDANQVGVSFSAVY